MIQFHHAALYKQLNQRRQLFNARGGPEKTAKTWIIPAAGQKILPLLVRRIGAMIGKITNELVCGWNILWMGFTP